MNFVADNMVLLCQRWGMSDKYYKTWLPSLLFLLLPSVPLLCFLPDLSSLLPPPIALSSLLWIKLRASSILHHRAMAPARGCVAATRALHRGKVAQEGSRAGVHRSEVGVVFSPLTCLLVCFWDKVLLCSFGWPQTLSTYLPIYGFSRQGFSWLALLIYLWFSKTAIQGFS